MALQQFQREELATKGYTVIAGAKFTKAEVDKYGLDKPATSSSSSSKSSSSGSSSSTSSTPSRQYFKSQAERNKFIKENPNYVIGQQGNTYFAEKRQLTESEAKKLGYGNVPKQMEKLRRSGRIQAKKLNVYGETPEKASQYVLQQLEKGQLAYADYQMNEPTRYGQKVFTFTPEPMKDITGRVPQVSYYKYVQGQPQPTGTTQKQQPPAGYKEVTFTNEEAMRYGLISRETSRTAGDKVTLYIKEGTTKAELVEYAKYLKEQHLDIKRDREKISDKAVPFDTWANLEKGQQQRAEYIAQDPLLKIRYVLEKDFLGIGTLHKFGVTALTGGNWDEEQKKMLVPYARELMSDKTPAEMQAWKFVGNVGFKVGVFQAMSKFPVAQFGAKAIASGVGGYQIGTGIKLAMETQGKATPEQGKQIAESFASGFLLTVPAQLEAYSKGVAWLRKPTVSVQVAGSKTKSISYRTEKGAMETRAVTVEKVNIFQKQGFMQKLGLRQPSKIGELYGEARSVSQSGQVLGVGQSDYVYAGTIQGRPVIFAGKQPQVSIYQADQNAIQGFTFSKSFGKYQFYKQPSGDIRTYQVGRFSGSKYLETPKADYWTYSQKGGGIQETNQFYGKGGGGKIDTFFSKIFGTSKSFSIIEKPQASDSFAQVFKAGGSLQTKPPTTGQALQTGTLNQIEAVIQQNIQGLKPSGGAITDIDTGTVQNFFTGDLGFEQAGFPKPKTKEAVKEVEQPKIPEELKPVIEGGKINLEKTTAKLKSLGLPTPKIIGGTKTKTATKVKQASQPKQDIMQVSGLGSIQNEIQKMFQSIGQAQWQGQRQATKTRQAQRTAQKTQQLTNVQSGFKFNFESIKGLVGNPSASSFPRHFESAKRGSAKTKARAIFGNQKLTFKKILSADLLSVAKSQLKFGKATHPAPTMKAWEDAESSFFFNVPTLELKQRGKKAIRSLI